MKYYSYENFKKDTNSLITQIQNSKFDVIIGIARGGLILTHALAEGLNIRNIKTIRAELYDKTNKRDKINIFDKCNLEGVKKVLIVDDIADSGETLKSVTVSLQKDFPEVEFQSVTLFYKKISIIEPTFWINETTEWIDFFWERDFINIEK
ncbi:MAG: phosphoribosyltransferase [Sulfurimonas sp.]|nr:phosphoribosyltransferase [Sulfurimonas sp.]